MWIECYDYASANRWFFSPLLIGLPICVLCVATLIGAVRKKEEKGCGLLILSSFAAFSLFWVIGVGHDLISTHLKYRQMLANRQYAEVEGRVDHFGRYLHTRTGIWRDTFLVDQVRVMVDAEKVRTVPAAMDSSGQVLANGQWVKIYYAPPVSPTLSDSSEEAREQRRWASSPNYHPVILKIWVKSDQD